MKGLAEFRNKWREKRALRALGDHKWILQEPVVVSLKPRRTAPLLRCGPQHLRIGARWSERTARRMERKGRHPAAVLHRVTTSEHLTQIADQMGEKHPNVAAWLLVERSAAKPLVALANHREAAPPQARTKLQRTGRGIVGYGHGR